MNQYQRIKRIFLGITILFVVASKADAQAQYEISQDTKHPEIKVLRGIINKYLIQNDTAFTKWYTYNQGIYSPDTATLNVFEHTKGKLHFILFGGTWCEDTQFVLPRFFKLQEMSGISDDMISFFGVNREKRTLGNFAAAFGITNVPTIIVMKEGKEIGRVVEYGKTGRFDKELADIMK